MEAYQAAIEEADAKGINVSPENEEWLELWFSIRDTTLPALRPYLGLD